MPIFKSVKRAIKHNYDASYLPKKIKNNRIFMECFGKYDLGRLEEYANFSAYHTFDGTIFKDLKTVKQNLSKEEYKIFKEWNELFPLTLSVVAKAPDEVFEIFSKYIPNLFEMKTSSGENFAHLTNHNSKRFQKVVESNPQFLYEKDSAGNTPAFNSTESCLDVIINNAPDSLLIQNNKGSTAAHNFIRDGKIEEAEKIMKSNPKILHIKDNNGRLLSHIAAMKARTDTLDFIFKHAPETLYMEDKEGNTPAHLVYSTESIKEYSKYPIIWFANNTPEIIYAKNKEGKLVSDAWVDIEAAGLGRAQEAQKWINIAKEKLEEIKKIEEEQRIQAEKAEQERIKQAEQKKLAEIKEEKKKQRIEKTNKNKQEIAEIAEMLLSTPQSLPEKLFDNSNENNKKLDKALDEVRKQLSEGYNSIRSQPSEAKKYVKQCQTKINRISKIITSKKTNITNSIKQNDSTLDNIIRAI